MLVQELVRKSPSDFCRRGRIQLHSLLMNSNVCWCGVLYCYSIISASKAIKISTLNETFISTNTSSFDWKSKLVFWLFRLKYFQIYFSFSFFYFYNHLLMNFIGKISLREEIFYLWGLARFKDGWLLISDSLDSFYLYIACILNGASCSFAF